MSLFCQENIELQKEIDRLSNELTEMQGKLMVEWMGESLPVPAVYPHMKSTDREIRKKAFECLAQVEETIADATDEIFDRLLVLRQQMAKNAGFESYTKYRFKEMMRFDWDESHCFEFHAAVRKHILPIKDKLLAERSKHLKYSSLKPYDLGADVHGRSPLMIYEKGDTKSLIEGAGKIIKSIDSELYDYFCRIRDNNLLSAMIKTKILLLLAIVLVLGLNTVTKADPNDPVEAMKRFRNKQQGLQRTLANWKESFAQNCPYYPRPPAKASVDPIKPKDVNPVLPSDPKKCAADQTADADGKCI